MPADEEANKRRKLLQAALELDKDDSDEEEDKGKGKDKAGSDEEDERSVVWCFAVLGADFLCIQ